MVEFRVNPTTGDAVLMEVNGRYWGTVSLPVSMGIDFPLYHWQLLHGELPSIPARYPPGQRWRFTVGYLNRLFRLMIFCRNSRSARAELTRTLVQLPMDFGPSVRDAMFTSSDPMPAIFEMAQLIRFFAEHGAKALRMRMPNLSRQEAPQKSTTF
jgi:predicted ATP-grasp superfamily ATP-dependent carboligase